jgi:chromosome segregation ATPase
VDDVLNLHSERAALREALAANEREIEQVKLAIDRLEGHAGGVRTVEDRLALARKAAALWARAKTVQARQMQLRQRLDRLDTAQEWLRDPNTN